MLLKSLALLAVDRGVREMTLSVLFSDLVDGVSGFDPIISTLIFVSSIFVSFSAADLKTFGDF